MVGLVSVDYNHDAGKVERCVANCSLGYVDPESDGGLEQDLASRRYRALLPDDEYDSDDY